jgi:hypothetical protein
VEWQWEGQTEVTGIASPRIGEIRRPYDYCRTGDHRPGGFFVARGPGLAPGRLSRTVSVLDFAPTFCEILGVEMPDADGSPIGELVESGRRSAAV